MQGAGAEKLNIYETKSFPAVNLEGTCISGELLQILDEKIARKYNLIPLKMRGSSIEVAMSDPTDIYSIDDLRIITGMEIVPFKANSDEIEKAWDNHYRKINRDNAEKNRQDEKSAFEEEIVAVNKEVLVEMDEDSLKEDNIISIDEVKNAPVVRMVNLILKRAVNSGASDIHIEPYEDSVKVRFRIDGQLILITRYQSKVLPAVVARIKVISGLNIAQKRLPQDGRIKIDIDGKDYDLRVSVLPVMYGEKVVIRIADPEMFTIPKSELGFFEDDLEKFDHIIKKPHGIFLVTGPTGSGKSTTLYTALREIAKPNVNILTVEDPVECTISGINQVQVNNGAGLNFAKALRSFLRQDPDIIMVGEIRDNETAEIAIRAAITGHLVLSTLHTNDAASSITRLSDMGIESFLLASSLEGIMAQRLVRRLCPLCKEEKELTDTEILITENSIQGKKSYNPKGCPYCNNTGYKGRIAVYEIMTIDNDLRELISPRGKAQKK
jgi:type IV pilus assembly protein PilB